MRKLGISLAAMAMLASTSTSAAVDMARFFSGVVFPSKGACEVALNHERNDRRQSGDISPHIRGQTFNGYVQWYFDCVEIDRGSWIVIRIL